MLAPSVKSPAVMHIATLKNKHVVPKDSMKLASIVSNVPNQSTGTPILSSVLLVNQDTDGMMLFTLALVAIYPDKSLVESVYVLPQKLNGTTIPKPAHAHQKPMVISVNLAQPPEYGTTKTANVFVPLPLLNGTELSVSAQLENMAPTVLNAPPLDIGIMTPTNVFVPLPSSGTVKTVSVLNHGSCGKEDVLSAQKDSNGLKIDVSNAHVHTKLWMS